MLSLLLLAAAASIDAGGLAQTSASLNALGPHPFGSPRNQAAAQFVAAKLRDAGLSQTAVEDFEFEGALGTNVVATLPGRTDRILIIATHHDSKKDSVDVGGRSRSLSILIEMGRQAATNRPAKTWILASFDGGESKGEGLARYLQTLGKSRGLVDGVVLIDAASGQETSGERSVIVPACAQAPSSNRRAMAGHDTVSAALGGIPTTMDLAFDDPGISLITQPFIRAFRTDCDATASRALASGLGVIQVSDVSFSKAFIATPASSSKAAVPTRDPGGALLGELAFAAVQGLDSRTPASPQSDSWLVFGRTVLPGYLIFLLGLAALAPGLISARSGGAVLMFRVAYSALFAAALYSEPEVALFAGALPSLYPQSAPKKFLPIMFLPLGLLLCAGAFGFARGHVQGSWLSAWDWLLMLGAFSLLFLPQGGTRKGPARTKRGKR